MNAKKIILMCKDTPVLEIANWELTVIKKELLPKGLRLSSVDAGDILGSDTTRDRFMDWLSGRVLSIDRHYAKKVLNVLKLSQGQSTLEKAKIAISFRAVSLVDSYWIKFSDDSDSELKWVDVSLRHNSLSKVVALIALTGTSMTLSTKNIGATAEVSTLGSYAKGWFRSNNGTLELYKTCGPEKDEVDREVCASKVINCFNVYGNIKYEHATMEGVKCSRCKVMTTDDKAIVHAADMQVWCLANGTDVVSFARKHYHKEFSQMIVIDYVCANSDRHGWNWGFYQSMVTGEILGLHDLYDHNNCFDIDVLRDEEWNSLIEDGKTMKEAAIFYVKRSGLVLQRKPKQNMFPSKLAYETFMSRCKQLGL